MTRHSASPTTENELDTPRKRKRTQVRFTSNEDVQLLRYVVESFPYNAPHGFKMLAWSEIANKLRQNYDVDVDGKRCKERTDLLYEQFLKDDKENLHRKSTDEDILEKESLLQQLKLMMDELKTVKKRSGYIRKSESNSEISHSEMTQEIKDENEQLSLSHSMEHEVSDSLTFCAYEKDQLVRNNALYHYGSRPEDFFNHALIAWKQDELKLEIQQIEQLLQTKKRHLNGLLHMISSSTKPHQ
ncbi:hypothetical protein ROZALSC1DRAFT_27977 [Rozella allomycis CSF55]|uniref:Myb-like domain-containing protein n=1 Tax=Rozella allomycis (strain CSF55) TaxID=988480 RepID=A0A075AY68_ROZAC|nr:hypothetical protein O9G_000407 [Rozella allomycis CSF55]RKP20546.1 hypothetical protein ROZALSC1DRAFT_27975 [Rozella allomycis CSF55]RKP20549.1 hypothetical protein ROZALSC1DRAFT_27977 [Rozella allomycis CSF55]|eukprot:EPZ33632.1 hypothetical protein O9G_000407 [Rozella allomycis CSF55]